MSKHIAIDISETIDISIHEIVSQCNAEEKKELMIALGASEDTLTINEFKRFLSKAAANANLMHQCKLNLDNDDINTLKRLIGE